MDLLDHLESEHRDAERLMDELDATDDPARRRTLVDELADALTTHMAVEEQFLYPIVTEALGREDRDEAVNEHRLARQGLDELRSMTGEPGFGAALAMLRAGLDHHVQEEEQEMFPELRSKAADRVAALDPDVLEAQVAHSRTELYEQAAAADVPGRSSMSKSELAEEVAKR